MTQIMETVNRAYRHVQLLNLRSFHVHSPTLLFMNRSHDESFTIAPMINKEVSTTCHAQMYPSHAHCAAATVHSLSPPFMHIFRPVTGSSTSSYYKVELFSLRWPRACAICKWRELAAQFNALRLKL
jgi:hypothetical protein